MECTPRVQRNLLIFYLFIAFANATTSSTTSSSMPHITTESLATTGSLVTGSSSFSNFNPNGWLTAPIMPPLCQDIGQVCDQEGQPTYAYATTPYLNVYYTPGVHNYSPAYASEVSYCEDLWASSLAEWLHTAPITYGPLIPQSIMWDTWPDITEISSDGTISSTIVYTTTETMTFPEDTGILAASFSTTTEMSVDFAGVEVTYTETFQIVELTYTETAYLGTGWAATTITKNGWASAVATFSAYSPAGFLSDFTWVPTSPCCKECTIFGGSVQVYYWPPATATPAVSTLVNSANFTLRRYVYDATTVAFQEGGLSTAPAYFWNTAEYNASQPFLPPLYTAATWEDQKGCVYTTESFYQWVTSDVGIDYAFYNGFETFQTLPSDWPTDSLTFYHYTVTNNPCSPTMAVPSQLFTINPLWSTCMQGIAGLFDPPYPLTVGNGLSAFTSADPFTDNLVTMSDAAAGATIASVTPTSTKTAANGDPATSVNNEPPAQTPTTKYPPVPVSSTDPPHQPPGDDPPAGPSPASNDPPAKVPSSNPPAQSPSANPSPAGPNNDPAAPSATSVPNDPPRPSQTIAQNLPPAVFTIGSSTITENSVSAFVIASQTLTPGSQITYSGTVLSLDPSGSAIVIGGTTTQFLAHATSSSAEFIIGSQTLSAGGPAVTFSGTTYSLQADGSSVVVDGSTQPMSAVLGTSKYLIASQTLIPGGPAITISGKIVSLETGGSSVVIGSQTEALSLLLGPSTTEVNIGGIIATMGGFGTPTTASGSSTSSYVQVSGTGYNGTLFLGAADRSRFGRSTWLVGISPGVGVLGILSL